MPPRKKPAANAADPTLVMIGTVLKQAGFTPQLFHHDDMKGYVMDLDDPLFEGAVAYIIEEEHRFVFAMDVREKGSEKVLPQMAEYIARANYGLVAGSFEVDYGDGSARFRAGLEYEGAELVPALVRNIILGGIDVCMTYVPGLVEVILGKTDPVTAIQAIEEEEGEEEGEGEGD